MTTRPDSEGRLATLLSYDCWNLLESAHIARVAWIGAEGVAVVPVNYTVVAGAVWFRTTAESTLARESSGQRVVVEVDQIDPATRAGWSVVVVGTAELVAAQDVPDMLIGLEVWPTGTRTLFVRVDVHEVSGRRLYGVDGA
jgi:nitroimidazol reductase NimA-like FMN-containing flavoprotein (pyridoxamine 5'-phosphate oxidase superfamily)